LLEPRKIHRAFVACQYEPDVRTLYIFDEAKLYKASSRTQYETLAAHGVEDGLIICDSAQQYTIRDYQEFGLNAVGAEKAHRDYSFKWLQTLDRIVIDKERCPDTYTEFVTYEYERTRSGEIISGFPKKNDHFIDAVRYMNFAWFTQNSLVNLYWRHRGM
jgi:phage terminase large subunit